jgi:tetratricopeptide (TPR) repeat protein
MAPTKRERTTVSEGHAAVARRRRSRWALALATALLAAPLPAAQAAPRAPTAAQKETARGLMQLGDAKLRAGDAQAALDAYRAADEIMGVPTTRYAVGRACARLGLLVEAVDHLQGAVRYPKRPDEPAAFAEARTAAARLDAELATRIPTLHVRVRGPRGDIPVELTIDESPVDPRARGLPQRLDPGSHRVRALADGYRPAELEVVLEAGESRTVELALAPAASPEPASPPLSPAPTPRGPAAADASHGLPTASWAAFGVGAAGLVLGTVTGAISLARASDLADRCPDRVCDEAERDEHDTILALANASNVGFALGAAGAAVGLSLWLFQHDDGDGPQANFRPWLTYGGAGLGGRF